MKVKHSILGLEWMKTRWAIIKSSMPCGPSLLLEKYDAHGQENINRDWLHASLGAAQLRFFCWI